MKKLLTTQPEAAQAGGLSRRRFLGYTGGIAGLALLGSMTSCGDDDDDDNNSTRVNLGSGDAGILNYAYALEQLEAAFYTRVIESPYSGITADEQALLTDIRDHEIAHREFFRTAITAAPATPIKNLTPNFNAINFGSRDSVLAAAKTFEDLGVSAYNGAGKLLVSASYLVIAGQIVSVEARHAAYIRDLISNGSFADSSVIDSNGLDVTRTPDEVIALANSYLADNSKLNGSNLPTN